MTSAAAERVRIRNLREFLEERGMKQNAAAVVGQCSEATISFIVNGKTRARPVTIINLARGFGVSPQRMRRLCDAHWLAAHPDEDPSPA